MNIIINILLLFIYLYGLFGSGIPDVCSENLILHKMLIILFIFAFQFLLLLFEKVIWKCKIDISELAYNSFMTSLIGILGYALFIDLKIMKKDNPITIRKSVYILYVVISIVFTVLMYKLFSTALDSEYQSCDKYE